MMSPEQFNRLPSGLQDIVLIDRELKDLASAKVIPLTAATRKRFAELRAERAFKRRWAATLWGHVARNNGSTAPA